MARYKQDINILERLTVWKLMMDTLKSSGIDICAVKSTDFDQVIVGKTLIYSIDIIKSTMESIKKANFTKK